MIISILVKTKYLVVQDSAEFSKTFFCGLDMYKDMNIFGKIPYSKSCSSILPHPISVKVIGKVDTQLKYALNLHRIFAKKYKLGIKYGDF